MQNPTIQGRMVDRKSALLHHFFDVSVTQSIREVQAHALQNDEQGIMTT
jgi:hypothetical protein